MGTGHRGEGTIQTKAGGLVTCLEVSGMLHLGIRTSFYSLRETGRRTQVDGGGGGGTEGEPSSSLQMGKLSLER